MRKYPIRDSFRAWDFVLTQDSVNGGIGLIPLSSILKNPDNQWVVRGTDGVGIPEGGAVGQVLVKAGTADYSMEWANVSGAGSTDWADVANKPVTFPPVAHTHIISEVTGLQSALDGKQVAGSYLASSAIGSTVQAYNAGTVVDASYVHTDNNFTAAQVSKLAGIATGATVNSPDATLLARASHTGTQLAATISDFASAVAATASVTANTAKVTNATHTGEVTGATALTITADAVTNTKLANMATATIKGRVTAATGDPEDLTAAQVRTLINVADGATANSSDASLRDRSTHTGTQAQSTVTNLTTDLAAKQPLDADLTALAALTGTNTIYYRSGADTWSPVTIGANVTFIGGVLASVGGVGGNTNLTYDAATRVIASDTGTDATLPLVSSGDAGLAPASGGGTSNFLRADGTWAAPAGGGGGASPIISWVI